jgi:hypothetical protein
MINAIHRENYLQARLSSTTERKIVEILYSRDKDVCFHRQLTVTVSNKIYRGRAVCKMTHNTVTVSNEYELAKDPDMLLPRRLHGT